MEIEGISDKPNNETIGLVATEDRAYPLGDAIRNVTGGNFDGILVDADGSETLAFLISGLGGDRLVFDEAFRNDPEFDDKVNYLGSGLGCVGVGH